MKKSMFSNGKVENNLSNNNSGKNNNFENQNIENKDLSEFTFRNSFLERKRKEYLSGLEKRRPPSADEFEKAKEILVKKMKDNGSSLDDNLKEIIYNNYKSILNGNFEIKEGSVGDYEKQSVKLLLKKLEEDGKIDYLTPPQKERFVVNLSPDSYSNFRKNPIEVVNKFQEEYRKKELNNSYSFNLSSIEFEIWNMIYNRNFTKISRKLSKLSEEEGFDYNIYLNIYKIYSDYIFDTNLISSKEKTKLFNCIRGENNNFTFKDKIFQKVCNGKDEMVYYDNYGEVAVNYGQLNYNLRYLKNIKDGNSNLIGKILNTNFDNVNRKTTIPENRNHEAKIIPYLVAKAIVNGDFNKSKEIFNSLQKVSNIYENEGKKRCNLIKDENLIKYCKENLIKN